MSTAPENSSKSDARPLLAVEDLRTHFFTDEGVAKAVDGVSFSVEQGKTLALVGESGCGKSVSALSILQLVPQPPGRIVGGRVLFQGRDLLRLSPAKMRHVRGGEIAMIFQEPATSLNPVFTIGQQIAEAVRLHRPEVPRPKVRDEVIDALKAVRMGEELRRVKQYPHQLSGGMKQRAMIAMALSCSPELLIADEPTTALDVTIQAEILDLLRSVQAQRGMALLLITHDLGVVAEVADDVAVMYAGKIVERASCRDLFAAPQHPYTRGLFQSIPRVDQKGGKLSVIEGVVPSPLEVPSGCRFRDRCPLATEGCERDQSLDLKRPNHWAACWRVAPSPDAVQHEPGFLMGRS